MPPALMVPPAIILSLTAVAWYATIAHYRPWGWVGHGLPHPALLLLARSAAEMAATS